MNNDGSLGSRLWHEATTLTQTSIATSAAHLGVGTAHSLFLIDQRFKRDAVPGEVNEAYLRFNRAGRSAGHCAEFCGTYHADMNVQVIVLEPEAFARWAAGGGGEL